MGGFMIIAPVLLTVLLNAATLLGFDILGQSVLIPLLVMVSFGILGAIDDWEGIRGSRKGLGMRARTKLLAQIVLGLGTAFALKYIVNVPEMYWRVTRNRSPGRLVHPYRHDHYCWFLQRGQFHRWAGRISRIDLRDCICRLRRHRVAAGAMVPARFCFTIVGAIWIPVVQHSSRRTVHG